MIDPPVCVPTASGAIKAATAAAEPCEDPPGVREGTSGKMYLAYLRDPDGNKLCALFRPAK